MPAEDAPTLWAWLGGLGIEPRGAELFSQAVTHPSFAHEAGDPQGSNQRLEFLGDAVLQLVISEYLFERLPQADEGLLTRTRASVVCEPALAEAARDIGLPAQLRLGKGEEATGGRERPSVLADALEALIGAAHLDQGVSFSRRFVLRLMRAALRHAVGDAPGRRRRRPRAPVDAKSALQEQVQAAKLGAIEYGVAGEEGPPHRRTFAVVVSVGGERLGRGSGSSKKRAEQVAARDALEELRRQGRIGR